MKMIHAESVFLNQSEAIFSNSFYSKILKFFPSKSGSEWQVALKKPNVRKNADFDY
jgi:hypothetical protein